MARVLGDAVSLNQSLEKAGRVDDFFELAQLMCRDALHREESCGGHFREEHQTPDVPARSADPAELRVKLTLRIWRQAGPDAPGDVETHAVDGVTDEMSFLELLDVLNERLIASGHEPIAFDSDCREGICGSRGLMIDGQAHGPQRGTATCRLHMRRFSDGDVVTVEPFRSAGFPIVKDLVVDRSAFDRIVEADGYITAPTGSAPDANLIAVPKDDAERAMDAAACIGCGACVARVPERRRPALHRSTSSRCDYLKARRRS